MKPLRLPDGTLIRRHPPREPHTRAEPNLATGAVPEMTETPGSTNVHSVGHDGSALYVRFHSGGTYRYPTAGQEHHRGMLAAPSKGGYVAQFLRGAHIGEKVR